MKEIFTKDLKENDSFNTVFLVSNKNLSAGKTGKSYIAVSLMDKTGSIEGRVWDNAEHFAGLFNAEDFVRVKGSVSAYMGKLQVKVTSISRTDDNDVDVEDFLPTARRPLEEMFEELIDIAGTMKDSYLKQLVLDIFSDAKIADDYKHAPAAKGMHHVYIGGLLEHSLSLCKLIEKICAHYEGVNQDLITTGAILHDVGKTRELSYSRSFGYTDEGRLLGHITIGVEMVDEKIRAIDGFPAELAMLVKHMILSHHGVYEYGSPKRPKTVEATILSYLDDLDAKVNSLQTLIESEAGSDSSWTGYHRLYERYIYKRNCLPQNEVDKTPKKETSNKADDVSPPEDKDTRKGQTAMF
ncbi:MAG: HD domain-containing protein [Proteobacteria bacterium]|nr:HD domain-containing protein [Pseudomonadota bacterium]